MVVIGRQREVGGGRDHALRDGAVTREGVRGGQGVVGGGRDRGERLALLEAAHNMRGQIGPGN